MQLTRVSVPCTALFLFGDAFLYGHALTGVILWAIGLAILGLALYEDWRIK